MGVDETNTVGQGFTPAARLVRMEQAPSLRKSCHFRLSKLERSP